MGMFIFFSLLFGELPHDVVLVSSALHLVETVLLHSVRLFLPLGFNITFNTVTLFKHIESLLTIGFHHHKFKAKIILPERLKIISLKLLIKTDDSFLYNVNQFSIWVKKRYRKIFWTLFSILKFSSDCTTGGLVIKPETVCTKTSVTPLTPQNSIKSHFCGKDHYNTSHSKIARQWGYYNTSQHEIRILVKIGFCSIFLDFCKRSLSWEWLL